MNILLSSVTIVLWICPALRVTPMGGYVHIAVTCVRSLVGFGFSTLHTDSTYSEMRCMLYVLPNLYILRCRTTPY